MRCSFETYEFSLLFARGNAGGVVIGTNPRRGVNSQSHRRGARRRQLGRAERMGISLGKKACVESGKWTGQGTGTKRHRMEAFSTKYQQPTGT